MPFKSMRRIKKEPGVGDAQEEEEEDEEAAAEEDAQQQLQHPSLRRSVGEGGLAVPEMRSQILSLRAHAETQAAAIRGMEQARVMGEQVVELKAEIKIKDAALQAKDAALAAHDSMMQATVEGKNALLQSKDAVIEAKSGLLQAKDAIILAKDAEIQRLQAELARCGAEAAVGGGARPAPAPARAAAAVAARVPAPAIALAPAPPFSLQQQVHISRPSFSPSSFIQPHALSPPTHPFRRRKRVLTRRSVCWRQGNTQLQ